MMRILVCGGRSFADQALFDRAMGPYAGSPDVLIIHGGASGADTMANTWAVRNQASLMVFRAEWGRYGRSAGPKRNHRMLYESKPDLVVAFPGGSGTADMVRRARKAGVNVVVVPA